MAVKSLMRGNAAESFLDTLIETGATFDLYLSHYTMKIILDDQIFNFTKNEQTRQTFAAYSKLKSALTEKTKPNIHPEDVSYFVHDFREPVYADRVCNIDLKSAYANILFRDGLIPADVHKYLGKLAKPDRLAAVGMLASCKHVYEFRKGEPHGSVRQERSEFSPFFFYAVKRCFEIMSELKKILEHNYLFTWVDGIYFIPDYRKTLECKAFLKTVGLPYSTEMLSEFEVKFLKRSIHIQFLKGEKQKHFDLPMMTDEFTRAASNFLINDKTQKNEKGKNCNPKKPRRNNRAMVV
jgi:hypothetical protein